MIDAVKRDHVGLLSKSRAFRRPSTQRTATSMRRVRSTQAPNCRAGRRTTVGTSRSTGAPAGRARPNYNKRPAIVHGIGNLTGYTPRSPRVLRRGHAGAFGAAPPRASPPTVRRSGITALVSKSRSTGPHLVRMRQATAVGLADSAPYGSFELQRAAPASRVESRESRTSFRLG
jgi:hypothetical protein